MTRTVHCPSRAATVEDFQFMSSIIGSPAAIHRIAAARGIAVVTVVTHLREAGVPYHLDSREVAA